MGTNDSECCPGRPGRLSAVRIFHSRSSIYSVVVLARGWRAFNCPKRRCPNRAGSQPTRIGCGRSWLVPDFPRTSWASCRLESVRARPGRLSARSYRFQSKSTFYGAFLWARRVLNSKNGGFRPGQMRCKRDMEPVSRWKSWIS
jgi:hypothetical protein